MAPPAERAFSAVAAHQPPLAANTQAAEPHLKQAFVFLQDASGSNSLTTLARYQARAERAFFRALHELNRLQAARAQPLADGILTERTHSQNRTPSAAMSGT